MLFIHEKFLVYKLETSRNCKEVKHMIMIIAIIYIFLSDVIFDQQLKSTFRQSPPPEKIHLPLFTHLPPPPKNWEIARPPPPFLSNWKFFRPCRKRGEDTEFKTFKRLTQPFIFPRSIKWVPGTPEDLEVKSNLSSHSGSVASRQFF